VARRQVVLPKIRKVGDERRHQEDDSDLLHTPVSPVTLERRARFRRIVAGVVAFAAVVSIFVVGRRFLRHDSSPPAPQAMADTAKVDATKPDTNKPDANKAAEEEAKKKAAEEDAKKKAAAEEEAKKKAEEDAKKKGGTGGAGGATTGRTTGP